MPVFVKLCSFTRNCKFVLQLGELFLNSSLFFSLHLLYLLHANLTVFNCHTLRTMHEISVGEGLIIRITHLIECFAVLSSLFHLYRKSKKI